MGVFFTVLFKLHIVAIVE